MSAAQASTIEARRWALVDDMCTTQSDLAAFYASPAWQEYLKHKESLK